MFEIYEEPEAADASNENAGQEVAKNLDAAVRLKIAEGTAISGGAMSIVEDIKEAAAGNDQVEVETTLKVYSASRIRGMEEGSQEQEDAINANNAASRVVAANGGDLSNSLNYEELKGAGRVSEAALQQHERGFAAEDDSAQNDEDGLEKAAAA